MIWEENPDNGNVEPEMVLFGCYGEINTQGNLTTVHRDGTISRTIPGAYSSSVLFGIEVLNNPNHIVEAESPPPLDCNVFHDPHCGEENNKTAGNGSSGSLPNMLTIGSMIALVALAVVVMVVKKRRLGPMVATPLDLQQASASGNYIELPTVSSDEDQHRVEFV